LGSTRFDGGGVDWSGVDATRQGSRHGRSVWHGFGRQSVRFQRFRKFSQPQHGSCRDAVLYYQLVADIYLFPSRAARRGNGQGESGYHTNGSSRACGQAGDDVLLEIGSPLDVVFDLQIDEQTCIERLLGRAREEGRSDDTPEAIATRLQLFRDATLPGIEHYRAQGKVVGVHAAGTVNEVFNEIQEALEQVGAR